MTKKPLRVRIGLAIAALFDLKPGGKPLDEAAPPRWGDDEGVNPLADIYEAMEAIMSDRTDLSLPQPVSIPIEFAGREYEARLTAIGSILAQLELPDGRRTQHKLPGMLLVVEIPIDPANAAVVRSSRALQDTLEDEPGQLVALLELQLPDDRVYEWIKPASYDEGRVQTVGYVGPRLSFDQAGRMLEGEKP